MTKTPFPSFLKNPKLQKAFLLISLVGAILILRSNDSSPTGFLKHTLQRVLQEESVQEALCGSTTMTEISEGEKERAEGIRDQLSRLRSGNPFIEFIEGPSPKEDFAEDYFVPVVKYAAPWIVFFAISFFGCLLCLVNCICMNTSCCKGCGICKKPKTHKFRSCLGGTNMFLGLLIIGTSIAGFVFSSEVWRGGKQTLCSLGMLLEGLLEGREEVDDHWVGLDPLIDKMGVVFNVFNPLDYVVLATQYTPATAVIDTAAINAAQPQVTVALTAFENDNQGKTVARADPSIGGTYVPTYIQNISNHRGEIAGEVEGKRSQVSIATVNVSTSLPILAGGSVLTLTIQSEINEILAEASNSSNSLANESKDFGKDGRKGIDGIFGGLVSVFAVFTLIALTSGFTSFFLMKEKESLKKCLNVCWCVLAIFLLFAWALSAILFPTGIVLVESCDMVEKFSTDPVFYNQTFDKFFPEADYETSRDILYSCLFDDGEVLEVLDIKKYFLPFEPLLYGLDATYPFTATSTYTVPDSEVIPRQQELVTNLTKGTQYDGWETFIDSITLNIMTSENSCTRIRDYWSLSSEICRESQGTVFTSSSAADFNLYSETCIGFDAWGNKLSTSRYSSSDVADCSSSFTYSELTDFITQFAASRAASASVFTDVNSDLTTVASANANFMVPIKTTANNMVDVRQGADPVYQALGNHTTGILRNTNCKWITQSLSDFHDTLCVRFVPGIFKTTIVIIITSFFGMFASFAIFCFLKRVKPVYESTSHKTV